MIAVLFAFALFPVVAVLGVLALQRKWNAFGVFAGVVVALFVVFITLIVVAAGDGAPGSGEPPPDGFGRVALGAAYAVVFADLAALLASPALFLRWERDRRTP